MYNFSQWISIDFRMQKKRFRMFVLLAINKSAAAEYQIKYLGNAYTKAGEMVNIGFVIKFVGYGKYGEAIAFIGPRVGELISRVCRHSLRRMTRLLHHFLGTQMLACWKFHILQQWFHIHPHQPTERRKRIFLKKYFATK